ncbi:AAA family ATPase [Aureimonas pseudogalii]|uniref:Putative kinase n=1 Tax=Aureimonas pseudogalii TaxID=1744844 RepID=A0A7W6H912_9HYPH|nr:AAA family ATPase [Aureimonas pseudogalii]MBB4000850.1 putative kinase [Aureimonas pseudogalii]
MLIVFGGLPGTGKSTICKALAAKNAFAYVRIEEIENALALHVEPKRAVGAEGYHVAFAVSLSNLRLGNSVVADSVNPVRESREGWRGVAREAGVPLLEVECVCGNELEHRRRVETRLSDVAGWRLPKWNEVRSREYETWDTDRLVIDTTLSTPEEAVRIIEGRFATTV